MIPSSQPPQRPSRRIVLLTKIKNTTMGLGSRTMTFFRKGEELEATGYETLPYDDPTLVPPKLGFRDVDKVPRNRAPLVIAVPADRRGRPDRVRAAFGEWARLKAFVEARLSTP